MNSNSVSGQQGQPHRAQAENYPYETQRQAALAWLGPNYLCHQPINMKTENPHNRKT